MMTAEKAAEWIRPDLARVIAAKEERHGSRMRAYEVFGAQIGRSATWVRKVLGRSPDVQVGLHDALNIRAAYERLCKHIADGTDAIEAENQKLRRELDVALRGDRPTSARLGGAPSAAEAPAVSARVAPASTPVASPAAAPRLRAKASGDLTELPLFGAMEPRP